MSKIALKSAEAGTATFTIQAPATNTNRVLELPDEAGKVLTDVSDIEPQVKTATNASGAAPIYACRAWVNFDGTGTVATRASGNVSSVTRVGVGQFTVNFATAMPDVNYSLVGLAGQASSSLRNISQPFEFNPPTTTSVRVNVTSTNGTNTDVPFVCISVFR